MAEMTERREAGQAGDDPEMADVTGLQAAAESARAAYEYAKAIDLYTEALSLASDGGRVTGDGSAVVLREPPSSVVQYDLLAGRAACYARLGNLPALSAD